MKAILPAFFRLRRGVDLIRLGQDFDGGYLVSKADVEKSDYLLSMALCDDWSFEIAFTEINDVGVMAFDASINYKFWIKRVVHEFINNPFNFYGMRKFYYYRSFFVKNRQHIKKFVGLDTEALEHISFSEIVNCLDRRNVFLKIDIEGSEYRLLDELVVHQDKISGCVIEFHDCDIHLDKIKNFINRMDLTLVHIHANNNAPIRSKDNLPLVLELTFNKYAQHSDLDMLPHCLDFPNNKNLPEILIEIEKS